MRSFRLIAVSLVGATAGCFALVRPPAPLPKALTNNATVANLSATDSAIYTFLGLDTTKRWSGITRDAFRYDLRTRTWSSLPAVPGRVGRLAATAQVVRGRVFVFGGYTVDSAGRERSLDVVDIFDPATRSWSTGTPMPLGVDDAVSGVWRDSLVYLVSGWHNDSNTTRVQIFDAIANSWSEATPIPGPGVFGHAGAIGGNSIVFIDGVRKNDRQPRYRMVSQAWRGEINPMRPQSIDWREVPILPAPPRYRAAAGACGRYIVFAGGSDNPYNYNGIGYDSVPSPPIGGVFAFDLVTQRWIDLDLDHIVPPSMDHRGLAIVGGNGWLVGGMTEGQVVSSQMISMPLETCSD